MKGGRAELNFFLTEITVTKKRKKLSKSNAKSKGKAKDLHRFKKIQ